MALGRDEFAKYHALGNDYIVLDGDLVRPALHAARVRALCDRHTGVGGDGVLALHRPRRGEIALRIWNPDGSEAEKSGNGARIFARFLWDFGYVKRRELAIATPGGPIVAKLSDTSDCVIVPLSLYLPSAPGENSSFDVIFGISVPYTH